MKTAWIDREELIFMATRSTRGRPGTKTREPARRTDEPVSSASLARQRMQKRRERERKRKMRIMASALAAALVIAIVGIVALVTVSRVNSYKGIYPNVYAAGVDLSGMTEEQAASAIQSASEAFFASQKVTLRYGTDMLDIYGSDISMKMDAPAAAKAAMAYGKNLSFGERSRIVRGKSDPVELTATTSFNPAKIEEKVNEFTQLVKDKIGVCSYEISDDAVVVDLSSGGEVLNKAAIVNDVTKLFEEGRFEIYDAVPEIVTAQTLDVDAIYNSVCCDPVDAELIYVPLGWTEETADQFDLDSYEGKKTYYIKPETVGLSFDLAAAKTKLAANAAGKIFEFPLIKTNPAVTKESLSSKIYADVIGRASSKLNPGEVNRTTNVRLATGFVNGTELMPGEVFSYNQVVGERTEKRGFKDAGTFVKGEVVDEIGGGICQLSSTVYMATLRSNLEQVSRSPHRYAVSYTPLGQDATVYWGSLDYQFKNNTAYPIKVYADLNGDTVTVKIYGTKVDDYTYQLQSVTNEEIDYEEETVYVTLSSKEAEDNGLTKIGQKKVVGGKKGYKSTTYVIKLNGDGEEVERWVANHSQYKARTKTTYIACVKDSHGNPILDENGKPYDPNSQPTTDPATETNPKPTPEPPPESETQPDTGYLPEPDPGPDAGDPNP